MIVVPYGDECYECFDCRRICFKKMFFRTLLDKRQNCKALDDKFNEKRRFNIARKLKCLTDGTRGGYTDEDLVDVDAVERLNVEGREEEYEDEFVEVKSSPLRVFAVKRNVSVGGKTDEEVIAAVREACPGVVINGNACKGFRVEIDTMEEGETVIRRGRKQHEALVKKQRYAGSERELAEEHFDFKSGS